VEVRWTGRAPQRVLAAETLTGPDLKASNTFAQPKRVVPQKLDVTRAAAQMTLRLPAGSYSVVQLGV
jgi:alpha-L-arabinofuranosidase